jgi:hypothetical protein
MASLLYVFILIAIVTLIPCFVLILVCTNNIKYRRQQRSQQTPSHFEKADQTSDAALDPLSAIKNSPSDTTNPYQAPSNARQRKPKTSSSILDIQTNEPEGFCYLSLLSLLFFPWGLLVVANMIFLTPIGKAFEAPLIFRNSIYTDIYRPAALFTSIIATLLGAASTYRIRVARGKLQGMGLAFFTTTYSMIIVILIFVIFLTNAMGFLF